MEISRTASDGLELLRTIAQIGPSKVETILRVTDTNEDTCLRRLHTLAGRGYVILHSDGTWGLGPQLIDLASRVPGHLTLAARDEVDALARELTVSVVIATAAPPDFMIRLEREGRAGPVRVEHLPGVRFALWQAAPGLALLPALDPETLADVATRAPHPDAIHTALDSLSQTGIVIAPSGVMTGRTGMAAPIIRGDGTIVASLTLAFTSLLDENIEGARERLLETSARIAERYDRIARGTPVKRDRQMRGAR